MKETRVYKNDAVLDYGFRYLNETYSGPSLKSLCSKAQSSITLVDTDNYLLNWFLKECVDILNEKSVVVAGLLDKKTLSSLKEKGVKSGFFRGTDESVGLGIVIIDKKEAWACFGEERVYQIQEGADEVFGYINHLLWAKSDFEFSSGLTQKVSQINLSVIKPEAKVGQPFDQEDPDYSTRGLYARKGIIVDEPNDSGSESLVIPMGCRGLTKNDDFYVEILPERYYRVSGKGYLKAKSFAANTLRPRDLLGEEIYYKGWTGEVVQTESLEQTVYVPLDQLSSYEPDYDAVYDKRKLVSVETAVSIDVLPMKRDDSYAKASNYGRHNQIEGQIGDNLDKLEKLELDKKVKKQIESVKEEKDFAERVRLYNELVSNLDYGVDALKNKKSNFLTINVSRESFAVPHELLGTLLSKSNQYYLAIKDEKRISDAKNWLKENGIKATLILEA